MTVRPGDAVDPVDRATALSRAASVLADAGLRGSLLVRHLGTGAELALEPDRPYPLASLIKLPLAGAVLAAAARGDVDLGTPVRITAAKRARGGPGLARFEHPVTVALGDLLHLAMEISDNTAADALFRAVPPAGVTAWVRSLGVDGVVARHPIEALYSSLAARVGQSDADTVHALVVAAERHGHPSPLPELDIERANAGTARGVADLLTRVWDGTVPDDVARPLRGLLAGNVLRQRLAPDLASDRATWSSKTGSFVHLRHEAGVVEHASGEALVVVALTRSTIPAMVQPLAEQAMGHAVRLLHDALLGAGRPLDGGLVGGGYPALHQ